MIKNIIFLISIFIFSTSTLAAKKTAKPSKKAAPVEISIKEQALSEIPKSQVESQQNPVIENWGLISVKNPFPNTEMRTWKYFLGLKLQRWQALGNVNLQTEKLDLSQTPSNALPSLEFGTKNPLGNIGTLSSKNWDVSWGLLGDFSYFSQANNFTFSSGYKTNNTKLNTFIFNAGPQLVFSQNSWWQLLFAFQLGLVSYNQTSETDLATFAKQLYNYSFILGAEIKMTENLGLVAETSLRETITKDEGLRLPNNNLEAGMRWTW